MDGRPKRVGVIGSGQIAAAALMAVAGATVARAREPLHPSIRPPYMRGWVKMRRGGNPGADARAQALREARDAANAARGPQPSNKARSHAQRRSPVHGTPDNALPE